MNRDWAFHLLTARPGYPVIFQIAPTAFQCARKNPPAVAMSPETSILLDPKNVRIHVVGYIESQMANEYVLFKRHIRRLVFSSANVDIRKRIFTNHRVEVAPCGGIAPCFDDGHMLLRPGPF